MYQDTAACHSAWGYCGKSQLQTAGRVLEAPAETEHQQLLAQPCLCASHLAKMETGPSAGFVSYMPQHNASPALEMGTVLPRGVGLQEGPRGSAGRLQGPGGRRCEVGRGPERAQAGTGTAAIAMAAVTAASVLGMRQGCWQHRGAPGNAKTPLQLCRG